MTFDDRKSKANVSVPALVAQRTEQRFPKTIHAVPSGHTRDKDRLSEVNSLRIGTSPSGFCAPVDLTDEYTGRKLRPLWQLAVSTKNRVLRRLVLQYEAEKEGVSIDGRPIK